MELRIQAIHFKAADHLKDYIQEKCNKLDHFFDHILDGEVFLKLEKDGPQGNKIVEIKVHVPHDVLIATETGKTFEEAADLCTNHLKRQIKRYKEKMRTH